MTTCMLVRSSLLSLLDLTWTEKTVNYALDLIPRTWHFAGKQYAYSTNVLEVRRVPCSWLKSTFTYDRALLPRPSPPFVYLAPASRAPRPTPRSLPSPLLLPSTHLLDSRRRPFLLVAVDNRYPASCVYIITLTSRSVTTPSSPEYPTAATR